MDKLFTMQKSVGSTTWEIKHPKRSIQLETHEDDFIWPYMDESSTIQKALAWINHLLYKKVWAFQQKRWSIPNYLKTHEDNLIFSRVDEIIHHVKGLCIDESSTMQGNVSVSTRHVSTQKEVYLETHEDDL